MGDDREDDVTITLTRDDDGIALGAFEALRGVDGTDRVDGYHRLTLFAGVLTGPLAEWHTEGKRWRPALVEVRVVASDNSRLGAYWLTCTRLLHLKETDQRERVDLVLLGTLQNPARPGVETLWSTWSAGLPTALGQWAELDARERLAWLEIARFRGHRTGARGERVSLTGASIVDLASLYCALGEALHGPGGFVGSDLDGLEAALTDEVAKQPLCIEWRAADQARRALGDDFTVVLDVLRGCGAEVRLG